MEEKNFSLKSEELEKPFYAFSYYEEDSFQGRYPSIEEALSEALSNINTEEASEESEKEGEDLTSIYVGEIRIPPRIIDGNLLLDEVGSTTVEEAGDWAIGYLGEVTDEQVKDLEKRVQKAWDEWEEEHGLMPDWYNVVKIKGYTVKKVQKMLEKKGEIKERESEGEKRVCVICGARVTSENPRTSTCDSACTFAKNFNISKARALWIMGKK